MKPFLTIHSHMKAYYKRTKHVNIRYQKTMNENKELRKISNIAVKETTDSIVYTLQIYL